MAGLDAASHAGPLRITSDKLAMWHRMDGRVGHGHDNNPRYPAFFSQPRSPCSQ
jgi:hypothetical protein